MNKYDILKELGFENYSQYLNSSLWKKIRSEFLIKKEYKCRICEKRADTIHHRQYTLENMSGKNDEYLVSLCKSCHYKIEFTKKKKNTLYNANRLLDRRIRKRHNRKNKDKIKEERINSCISTYKNRANWFGPPTEEQIKILEKFNLTASSKRDAKNKIDDLKANNWKKIEPKVLVVSKTTEETRRQEQANIWEEYWRLHPDE